MVDGGVLGQGEDVDTFRPCGTGIRELLPDARPRHDSGHDDADVRLERRRGHERALLGGAPEQGAFGDAADLRPGGLCRQDGDQAHEDQSLDEPQCGPHRLDYRSPAGDVESARGRSIAVIPTIAGQAGTAAAGLRNPRGTRRLGPWHSLPGSAHRAPPWPLVPSWIDVLGTPSAPIGPAITVRRIPTRITSSFTPPISLRCICVSAIVLSPLSRDAPASRWSGRSCPPRAVGARPGTQSNAHATAAGMAGIAGMKRVQRLGEGIK